MQSARATRVSWDGTVLVTSVAVMLMGLGVIVGWHAHIPAFVRLFPGTIAMQYNTALCFLALGAAGVGLSKRRRLWLLSGGSIAALMGVAVILEYATGVSFGIDTFFFYPWERTLSADPGRMALTIGHQLRPHGCGPRHSRRAPGRLCHLRHHQLDSAQPGADVARRLRVPNYVRPPVQSGLADGAADIARRFSAYGIAMLGYAWKYAERGPDGLAEVGAGIGVALLPVLLVGSSALVS